MIIYTRAFEDEFENIVRTPLDADKDISSSSLRRAGGFYSFLNSLFLHCIRVLPTDTTKGNNLFHPKDQGFPGNSPDHPSPQEPKEKIKTRGLSKREMFFVEIFKCCLQEFSRHIHNQSAYPQFFAVDPPTQVNMKPNKELPEYMRRIKKKLQSGQPLTLEELKLYYGFGPQLLDNNLDETPQEFGLRLLNIKSANKERLQEQKSANKERLQEQERLQELVRNDYKNRTLRWIEEQMDTE